MFPSFDVIRYMDIQSGAIAHAGGFDALIGAALADGARNIFFLGAGGAAILMEPAVRLLQQRSSFPVHSVSSAELVLTGHAQLSDRSIVVIPSLSGTTNESIAAMSYCAARGARIVTLIGHADTPLGRTEHAFVNFAEDDTSSESFYLQSLLIALSVMRQRGELEDYGAMIAGLQALPAALVTLKQDFAAEARRVAEVIAARPWHIVTGAGNTWPVAFYYGMCILEEMQWIRTRPVHASDFFHGTLELVESGVSLLLLKGEDACRPLAERVEAFAGRYTQEVTVLDSAALALPGVPATLRTLLSPVLLAAALERVSANLEILRDHPLTTRRYYKRVAY